MPDPVFVRPLRAMIRRQPTEILYRPVAGQAPAHPLTVLLSLKPDTIEGFGAGAGDDELVIDYVTADLPVSAANNAEVEFVSGGAHCRIGNGTRLRVKKAPIDDGGCGQLWLGRKPAAT